MIVISFLLVSMAGWALLMLPASSTGDPLHWLDALFLSVSAVCVTGLSTINVGEQVSSLGHVVVLLLIQVGGLNYMVISTAFMVLMGKKLLIRRRMVLREAMGHNELGSVVDLWRVVLGFTLTVEALGALALATRFVLGYGAPLGTALWLGLFHSVSAFCNAGLDLFGRPAYGAPFGAPEGGASLALFARDPIVVLVVAGLIVLGGLGFVAVLDLLNRRIGRPISTHTRVVLSITAWLIGLGLLAFLCLEATNPATLGQLPWPHKVVGALFQSITPRTAGFCTFDQGALHTPSKLLTIFLMIVGASPGGTGGGVKTSTFLVILLAALASVRGDDEIHAYHRRISHGTVYRALAVGLAGVAIVGVMTFWLTLVEHRLLAGGALTEVGRTLDFFFESSSAFGTVGLSTGITAGLAPASKLGLIATMLAGRIGPVTLAVALVERRRRRHRQYPEGTVMIG